MIRIDGPTNADGDDNRDILALLDISDAEVEAGWCQFTEHHLQPDHLFRLAVGLEGLAEEDSRHLESCKRCRAAYKDYRSVDSDIAAVHPAAPSHQEKLWNDCAIAFGDRKLSCVSRPSSNGRGNRPVPDLLRRHLHVEVPVVFPGDEVALESWQFGRILQVARTHPELADQIVDIIAERAKNTLLPRLTRGNLLLVCFGRTMLRCGTRLAALLSSSGVGKTHVIYAHDFYSPTLVCDPKEFRNAEVVVIVDVVHSGTMLDNLMSICLDRNPQRVHGLALIDQSGGRLLCAEWLSVWAEEQETRVSIEEFLRVTPTISSEHLQRYEPNDECAVPKSLAELGLRRAVVTDRQPISLDPELVKHIHATGALKRDFRIAQKSYPYVVNVLDLLNDSESRQFILNRAMLALSDLSDKKICLAYHAGRWQRAGAIARMLSAELRWPLLPIGTRGAAFTVTDQQYRRLASYNTVVIVDAAIRTGDSISAIARALDDAWLRKHVKFVAFCVLDALSSVSQSQLAEELGIRIRTLFQMPLTPPTEQVRHWANLQKTVIRNEMSKSAAFASIRRALGSYCEVRRWQVRNSSQRSLGDTTSTIEKAIAHAHSSENSAATIDTACREGKAHFIRHLSVSEVVRDRSAQDLLLGVMFNSMAPSFKESAALALAAARNYEWMTLDWLKCNRPFLTSPSNAWKSIVLVECQMRLGGRSRELSQFGDAAVQFCEKYIREEPNNGQLKHSQLMLPQGEGWAATTGSSRRTSGDATLLKKRLIERLDVVIEAAR